MEQYISKSAVLAEIDKVMAEEMKFYETACKEGDEEVSSSPMVYTRLQILRSYIDTLEAKEVDLEMETKKWWKEHLRLNPENKLWMDAHQSIVFAKHFFELGLNAQSSYVSMPNIDDTLKEMGVEPDSKEANTFKESYFRALDKLQTKQSQKGEKA